MQRMLTQSRVVLHDLQALSCVALVLGRCVVVLAVLCTHDAYNFSGFRFLRHFWSSLCRRITRSHARQPEEYDRLRRHFATAKRR